MISPNMYNDPAYVDFIGPFRLPNHGYINSPYSVNQINNREVPWLRTRHCKIYAGIPLDKFVAIVIALGGDIMKKEVPEE